MYKTGKKKNGGNFGRLRCIGYSMKSHASTRFQVIALCNHLKVVFSISGQNSCILTVSCVGLIHLYTWFTNQGSVFLCTTHSQVQTNLIGQFVK